MESIPGVISNWHTLFEDFSTSTRDFYASVEEAIARRNLPEIEISRVLFSEGGFGSPNREYLRISRRRVAFDICSAPYGNGHFFSWWLARIPPRFGAFVIIGIFLLVAALTGLLYVMLSPVLPKGLVAGPLAGLALWFFLFPVVFLVMGYLVQEGAIEDEEWVMSLPIIGWLYGFIFTPHAYYRLDSAMMFRDSIRAAVNEVINDVRQEKGLRLLGEGELLPDARREEAAG